MINILGLTLSLIVSCNTFADMDVSFTIKTSKIDTLTNEITFVAPPNHHFNGQSPSLAEGQAGGNWVRAHTLNTSGNEVKAFWEEKIEPCHLRAHLYMCDDANTYCLPIKQNFSCRGKEFYISGWLDDEKDKVKPTEESIGSQDGFILNDARIVFEKARVENKLVLIDFFGIWCPPCNMLDETVFSSEDFSKLKGSFILLKIDVDKPLAWDLKSKYKIRGYPTVLFTTPKGDEIDRILGARTLPDFIKVMKKALSNKTNSFVEAKRIADEKNDKNAALQVGNIYLNRREYHDAHFYYLKSILNGSAGSARKNLENNIMSATLGIYANAADSNSRQRHVALLKMAIEKFPHYIEALDRADELVNQTKELENKSAEREVLNLQINTAKWFLKNPKALQGSEWTFGDLYQVIGDSYGSLTEIEKSRESYKEASKYYLKQIQDAHLNENSERGFNLERIYCLWKSGRVEEARQAYEKLEKIYPEEFTFYYQHGRLLDEIKLPKEAQGKAEKAYKFSYGDNHLRSAALLAKILKDLGESAGAQKILDETMKNTDLPEDKSVRTHRYFEKLQKLKAELK